MRVFSSSFFSFYFSLFALLLIGNHEDTSHFAGPPIFEKSISILCVDLRLEASGNWGLPFAHEQLDIDLADHDHTLSFDHVACAGII